VPCHAFSTCDRRSAHHLKSIDKELENDSLLPAPIPKIVRRKFLDMGSASIVLRTGTQIHALDRLPELMLTDARRKLSGSKGGLADER
jgi:hypothetical protein